MIATLPQTVPIPRRRIPVRAAAPCRALRTAWLLGAIRGDRKSLGRLVEPHLLPLTLSLLRRGFSIPRALALRAFLVQDLWTHARRLTSPSQVGTVLDSAVASSPIEPRGADALLDALSNMDPGDAETLCRIPLGLPAPTDTGRLESAYRALGEDLRTAPLGPSLPDDLLPCPDFSGARLRRTLGSCDSAQVEALARHEASCRFCDAAAGRLGILHDRLVQSLAPLRIDADGRRALLRTLHPPARSRSDGTPARLGTRRAIARSAAAHAVLLAAGLVAFAAPAPLASRPAPIRWEALPILPPPSEADGPAPDAIAASPLDASNPSRPPVPDLVRLSAQVPDAPALAAGDASGELLVAVPTPFRPTSTRLASRPAPVLADTAPYEPPTVPLVVLDPAPPAAPVAPIPADPDPRGVHRSWLRIARRLVVSHGARMETLDEARRYALGPLETEVSTRLADRHGTGAERVREWFGSRPTRPKPFTATYGTGSWMTEPVTRPGAVLPDPQTWWANASIDARRNYLWAFYCENRLRVRGISHIRCPACTGEGQFQWFNPAGLAQGTDRTVCPSCRGAGAMRQISYE